MSATNQVTVDRGIETLLQSVTDYVVAINRNYEVIMANDLFRNEFVAGPDARCYQLWRRRENKCEGCVVAQSFEDGKLHVSEEKVIMKDGRIALMRVESIPVRNIKGEIICVFEIATDITRRRDLEKRLSGEGAGVDPILTERIASLQKSEEKYRTIFERSRDTIVLTDSSGRILDINQAGVKTLGYDSKDELLALGSLKVMFERDKDLADIQRKVSREGVIANFESRIVGKNGCIFDALITSNVILDRIGEITGYALIITDITRAKNAYKEIEKRNLRLHALNSISWTVSSSLDLSEVLQRTIDMILDILELGCVRIYLMEQERSELRLAGHKGLSKEFISRLEIQRRGVGDGFLGRAAEQGKIKVIDNLAHCSDPYISPVIEEGLRSTVYIPLISHGESVGVMAVSSQSPFKFSEDYVEFLSAIGAQIGVAVHNAHLYERLRRAYEELRDAQEQVQRTEKLASLGKLAATIAHEINNPIASILTYTRLIMKLIGRNQFKPEKLQDISRYLGVMESETKRCGEIVKNLLAFSRQSDPSVEPHSIGEIIERTLPLIEHELSLKGIQLIKMIPDSLPLLLCDLRQIQQALLNLMMNAAEAMTDGGTLAVEARLSDKQKFIEIRISDTGIGIPKEHIKDIFVPFFTTKEEGKGVGLGLSVVYGIITRHGGSIEVESEEGNGSMFIVSLPTC